MAPSSIVLTQQLVTIETFSFPCWYTNRHTNACVQFPAVDIFPVTELNSPSPFIPIFSHIFNLLSAFTYDSPSLWPDLPPSTIPQLRQFCPVSLSSLPTYPQPRFHPIPSHHRSELGAIGRLECACAYTRTVSTACSHHRDSETWNSWAQQVIDWQPTRATGALRTYSATKLKIPIRLGGFFGLLLGVCSSLNQDQRTPRLFSLRSSVGTVAVRFHSGIATSLFPLIALV